MDRENSLLAAKGQRRAEVRIGELGLADGSLYTENG